MKYKEFCIRFFAASTVTPEEIKGTLKEILARKEFQTGKIQVSLWEKLLGKLAKWLEPFFEKLIKWLDYLNIHLDVLTLKYIVKIIAVLSILVVLFTILYFYLGLNRKILFDVKKRENDLAIDLDIRDPEKVYYQAEEQAKEENYRQALRLLYFALLLLLDSKGIICYDPARTNWEYLDRIRGEANELEASFYPFTRLFDRKWYGLEECKAEDYALGMQFYADIVGRFRL